MLSQIKVYLVAGLGILTAVFYALFQREKAKRADEHKEIAEHTAEKTKDATGAMVQGLNNEEKIKNAKRDSDKRDHFT